MRLHIARAALAAAMVTVPAFVHAQNSETPVADSSRSTEAVLVAPPAPSKTFFVRSDLAYTGAALVTTGVVSVFDKRIERYFQSSGVQGTSSRHNVASKLTKVNETTLTIASVLGYGVGRLIGSPTVADVGLHVAESVVLTSVVSQIIRGPLGRNRPSISPDDQYKFNFGKGFTHFDNRAFPSLHSATAFAAASALVGEINQRNPGASAIATPVLYAAAIIPGVTRMYLNQHWASDVVAGAFVGTLLGSRVVSYAHSHNRNKLDRILLGATVAPDGHGGTMVGYSMTR